MHRAVWPAETSQARGISRTQKINRQGRGVPPANGEGRERPRPTWYRRPGVA
jgi:hypothetical protein